MISSPLSTRLRDLRRRWPGRTVKQSRVAEALGVTTASISSYENGVIPPVDRLRDYALLFASPRWLDPDAPRRVSHGFLNGNEQRVFSTLNDELLALRSEAMATPTPGGTTTPTKFWEFPDGAPVRIFCGRLDAEDAGPYSDVSDPNFMRLRNAADLDSLFELWGHIRRLNPDNDVRFVLGDEIGANDLTGHIVVVGNIAQTQGAGRLLPNKTLTVRQASVENLDGEVFEIDSDDGTVQRFEPEIVGGRVVADVGLLARMQNPHRRTQSLIVCSGVFTRGVYGAVRSLTDLALRNDNADYLRERFGEEGSFEMLFPVRVAGDTVVTPTLRDVGDSLYTSPPPTS